MRKSLSFLLISVLLAALLSACAAATPAATTAPEVETDEPEVEVTDEPEEIVTDEPEVVTDEPAEPITLSVYVVDFVPDVTDVWLEEEVVPAFQEMHPNVEVEFIWGSWSTFNETVSGYFTTGEGPDIINLGSEHNGLYGDQLAPLNEYLGPDAYPEIDQFIPGTLENASWEGELRGLPIFAAPRFVYCRTDLMPEGMDAQPTDFAGWLEYVEAATVIDAATNTVTQEGFNVVGLSTHADWQWYLNTIWSLGASIYKEDGTANFDSAEADAALQFNYDLHRAIYPTDDIAAPTYNGSVIDEPNNAACVWHSGWGMPALDDDIWERIDTQPFTGDPTNFPDSTPVAMTFVDWWAVAGYSPNVEMAAEFLKFVFNKDNNNEYASQFPLIPARSDAAFGFVEESPVMAQQAELAAQYAYGFAGIVEPTKLQEIIQAQLGLYLTDQQDKETTLANIQEQYNEVLAGE